MNPSPVTHDRPALPTVSKGELTTNIKVAACLHGSSGDYKAIREVKLSTVMPVLYWDRVELIPAQARVPFL